MIEMMPFDPLPPMRLASVPFAIKTPWLFVAPTPVGESSWQY